MKIGILTTPTPFFFGPYAKQSLLLASYLIKQHDIYFIPNAMTHYSGKNKPELVPLNIVKKKEYDEDIYRNNKEVIDKIKFVSMYSSNKNAIIGSSINDVIDKFDLDKMITLMDLLHYIIDINEFNCEMITWFPNHYEPLDNYSMYVLRMFDKIVPLSPNGAEVIKKALPHKYIESIPHIMDITPPIKTKKELRKEYNIPDDKYVVCIVGGNYEQNYRRSVDTSIMAFEQFHKNNPNTFLYIQSFSFENISFVNDIHRIISYLDIKSDSYILSQEKVPYSKILEIFTFSDVCLSGSKSEGFGVPNIEAQLCGTPVITNGFSAYKDYTFYGLSMPSAQQHYDHYADGIWSMPSIDSLAGGLERIYKEPPNNKDDAIEKIRDLMNINTVGEQFDKVLDIELDYINPRYLDIVIKLNSNVSYNPCLTEQESKQDNYIKMDINSYIKIMKQPSLKNKMTDDFKVYTPKEIMKVLHSPYVLYIDENCNVLGDWLILLPKILNIQSTKSCIILKTGYKSDESKNNTKHTDRIHENGRKKKNEIRQKKDEDLNNRIFLLFQREVINKVDILSRENILKEVVHKKIPLQMTETNVNVYVNNY